MRVLIVEDEALIREGLMSMVDWVAEGFSEVIGCENAVDALEVLSDRGSDLVITDLFMQSLSGLEMIEMARNMEIDTRFVILTGHGLFEYAQKAVALGVKRFLTKPIQPDELLALLREMRDEILAQQRMEQSLAKTQEKLREYYPVVCRQYWQMMVGENAPEEREALRQAALYDVKIPQGQLMCVALGADESSLTLDLRIRLRQALEALWGNRLVCLLDQDVYLLAVLTASQAQGELEGFPTILQANLALRVWLGVGRTYDGLGQLHLSAHEAMDALKAVIGIGDCVVSYYQDIKSVKGEEAVYPAAQEEKVLESLRYRDQPDLQALGAFIDAVYECHAPERSLMLLRFQVALYRLAESSGVTDLTPFHPELRTESRQEAYERLCLLVEETARRQSGSQQKAITRIVEEAKRIMRESYSDPSLNIAGIARQLYVSPQYLSRLFRSVCDETCMDYLTGIRMAAAREMLRRSSVKSYEIALKVGYNNPNYFSALFKRRMGISPRAYRRRSEGEEPGERLG